MSNQIRLGTLHILAGLLLVSVFFYFAFLSQPQIKPRLNITTPLDYSVDEELAKLQNIGAGKGDTAPNFTLSLTDGKTVTLSEAKKDKPVLLYFFATWCLSCIEDLKTLKPIYENSSASVNFIVVDVDSEETVDAIKEFKEKYNFPYQFAAANDDLLIDYGIINTATKVAITKDIGKIVYKGAGELGAQGWAILFKDLPAAK